MDWHGLSEWEAHVVATLAGPASLGSAERALARVTLDARRLARWRPAAGRSLREAVAALSTDVPAAHELDALALGLAQPDAWRTAARVASEACRAPWSWPPAPDALADVDASLVAPAWLDYAPAVRRYLAAKAFGSWLTYQCDAAVGLASWLRLCLGVLRVEAARACQAADRTLDRRPAPRDAQARRPAARALRRWPRDRERADEPPLTGRAPLDQPLDQLLTLGNGSPGCSIPPGAPQMMQRRTVLQTVLGVLAWRPFGRLAAAAARLR